MCCQSLQNICQHRPRQRRTNSWHCHVVRRSCWRPARANMFFFAMPSIRSSSPSLARMSCTLSISEPRRSGPAKLLRHRLRPLECLNALSVGQRLPARLFPREKRGPRLNFVLRALDGSLAGASHREPRRSADWSTPRRCRLKGSSRPSARPHSPRRLSWPRPYEWRIQRFPSLKSNSPPCASAVEQFGTSTWSHQLARSTRLRSVLRVRSGSGVGRCRRTFGIVR